MDAQGAGAQPPCASFVSPRVGSRSTFWYLLLPTVAFLAFLVGPDKPQTQIPPSPHPERGFSSCLLLLIQAEDVRPGARA